MVLDKDFKTDYRMGHRFNIHMMLITYCNDLVINIVCLLGRRIRKKKKISQEIKVQ